MLAADGEACSLEAGDAIGVGDAAEIFFLHSSQTMDLHVFFLKR